MSESRQIVIAEVPDGPLSASNFAARDAAMPQPQAGEILVETLAITIGAGQRAGLQGSASYAGAAASCTRTALMLTCTQCDWRQSVLDTHWNW